MLSNETTFQDLVTLAVSRRDEHWETELLQKFAKQKVRLLFPDPKPGPDQWPYLMVSSEVDGHECESCENILVWLSTRGIGLVLNPQKATPDFVLTYGMIWNYRERGVFLSPVASREQGELRWHTGKEILAGTPSENFLPVYARSVLRQFFLDQGVFVPKVLMISEDNVNYDLCFSLESLGHPPVSEHAGIAEAIAWFLPAHYSIVLLSEKTVPGFAPL